MGQDNICCCKTKEKNEIEFDGENHIIEHYENLESMQSPINSFNNNKNLKSYVNTKNTLSLNKDDTSLSVKEDDEKILKSEKKTTRILSLRKKNSDNTNNNSLFGLKNKTPKKVNKLSFNLLNKEVNNDKLSYKFFTHRAHSTITEQTKAELDNFFVLSIQKLYKGYIFRKKYFTKLKEELEKETIKKLKEKYNEYLTENLIKQESILGIPHNEDSYKDLLLIKNQIKNSNNLFTKLLILTYNDLNAFYVGEININNKLNGRGILTLNDGTKYNGNFIENEFTGEGTLINKNGGYYKGNFKNGLIEGNGICKNLNGITYEGNFENGKKNGYGKEESSEYIYEGEFKNDLKNGKGKLNYKLLNESYEGTFEDNNITGYGLYKWNNGESYKGTFINGKMDGSGKYIWPDGGYYEGDYVNNIKEGKGIFKWANGKIFDGNFKNGEPNGIGILTIKNVHYKVNFVNGKIKGKVIEIDKGENYKKWKVNENFDYENNDDDDNKNEDDENEENENEENEEENESVSEFDIDNNEDKDEDKDKEKDNKSNKFASLKKYSKKFASDEDTGSKKKKKKKEKKSKKENSNLKNSKTKKLKLKREDEFM